MPPNEIDDIWMSDKTITKELYHGHIFLIGLQKLRFFAKLSGFKITEIRYVRLSKGSLLLFPVCYPIILINSLRVYYKHMKKNKGVSINKKRDVFKEQLLINISAKNLLNRHTFIVLEKENEYRNLDFRNDMSIKKFERLS